MTSARCEDKADIDKIDLIIVCEHEILMPMDQARAFSLCFWVILGRVFWFGFCVSFKKLLYSRTKVLRETKISFQDTINRRGNVSADCETEERR